MALPGCPPIVAVAYLHGEQANRDEVCRGVENRYEQGDVCSEQ